MVISLRRKLLVVTKRLPQQIIALHEASQRAARRSNADVMAMKDFSLIIQRLGTRSMVRWNVSLSILVEDITR